MTARKSSACITCGGEVTPLSCRHERVNGQVGRDTAQHIGSNGRVCRVDSHQGLLKDLTPRGVDTLQSVGAVGSDAAEDGTSDRVLSFKPDVSRIYDTLKPL